MPPLDKNLYLVKEWWRDEIGRLHTKFVESIMYSVSQEANLVDKVLSLITSNLRVRFVVDHVDTVQVEAIDTVGEAYCLALNSM